MKTETTDRADASSGDITGDVISCLVAAAMIAQGNGMTLEASCRALCRCWIQAAEILKYMPHDA